MLFKWICFASVDVWAHLLWFVVVQNGCLLLAVVFALVNCKKGKKQKPSSKNKVKKPAKTTSSGTTTGGTTTTPEAMTAAPEIAAIPKPSGTATTTTTTTTDTDTKTKTADAAVEKPAATGSANIKIKKKKKKTEDCDEKKATEEGKEPTLEFNHENTLRIEMTTTDCVDAYNPGEADAAEAAKLEKKQSQHAKKGDSKKVKGKGKKKKDPTVQSIDCAQVAEEKGKDKVHNSKKSKKSEKKEKQPRSANDKKLDTMIEDEGGAKDKKMATMIEDETPQTPKGDHKESDEAK
uniref:Uncharacterized protein n=1 Tax=Caenorhabditis tropicalis TaxID=1561998 RepID=A0A1I7UX79_9PELO